MTPFDATTPMFHGTAAAPFEVFGSGRPAFFTSNRDYAAVYMGRGTGLARVIETRLAVVRPFVGDSVADVAFWNEGFVPWMRTAYPSLSGELRPIVPRDGAPFVWADEFFVHLRRTMRAGTCPYDGMVVDEGGTGAAVGGSGITVVPLTVDQITIVSDPARTARRRRVGA